MHFAETEHIIPLYVFGYRVGYKKEPKTKTAIPESRDFPVFTFLL